MQKIILYYRFCKLKDPNAVMLWQYTLAQSLDLKGRIIISEHGINGTLGGDIEALKNYIKQTKGYLPFKGIKFKWSDGSSQDFPKLSVKVKDEIVTFGVKDKIKVNSQGIIGGAKKIKPSEINKLIKEKGKENIIFFDGRNSFESKIGKFKDALTPNVEHSRYFPSELKKTRYQKIKDKTVITYCTGGIRCEVLSMLMKEEGFKDVYQIEGGIVKYGEKFKDKGLWHGKLYVFDKRMATAFSSEAEDIAKCLNCRSKTSNYINCFNKACNKLILICTKCTNKSTKFCQNCSMAPAV